MDTSDGQFAFLKEVSLPNMPQAALDFMSASHASNAFSIMLPDLRA